MEGACIFFFENYCHTHNKIDLATLGKKLAMDHEAAVCWIVDLFAMPTFKPSWIHRFSVLSSKAIRNLTGDGTNERVECQVGHLGTKPEKSCV
jgi:hypothetical protein